MKLSYDLNNGKTMMQFDTTELNEPACAKIVSLIKGELAFDFGYEIKASGGETVIEFTPDGFDFAAKEFKTVSEDAALGFIVQFAADANDAIITDYDAVYIKDGELKYLPAIAADTADKAETVAAFIDRISADAEEFNPELKDKLIAAAQQINDNPDAIPQAIEEFREAQRAAQEAAEREAAEKLAAEQEAAKAETIENQPPQIAPEPTPEPIPQTQPATYRLCPSCGARYEEEFMFCIKCGTMLEVIEETPQPIPQPEPTPVPEPIPEPIPQPEPTPVPEPIPQPIPQPEPTPIPEPIPQPIPQPEPTPVPQPIPQPIPHPEPTPIPEPIPEPIPQPEPTPVPEPIPQPIPQSEPTPIPEPIPEPIPQPEPTPVPQPVADNMHDGTTLLGFTNFGETSILGGNAMGSFNTPNLVRQTTNEKIFITKRNFLIGKSSERADYTVTNNNAISRVHAEISVVGNEYYVVDKNSTNKTYVNNRIVNPDTSVQIFEGDEIKLANEVFTFHLQ